ncbi:MAG: hypothetical protein ABL984_02530 [Pyrinomonadaceae bacterium]
MKAQPKQPIATTRDLRHRLKTIVEAELERLPETLDGLTAMQRLDVVLKLMPLVVPRSKPVHHRDGEPSDW